MKGILESLEKTTVLGGVEIPHDHTAILDISAGSTQDETKQDRRCAVVAPSGPWRTSAPLSHECSQQDLPRRFFVGHSVTWPNQ